MTIFTEMKYTKINKLNPTSTDGWIWNYKYKGYFITILQSKKPIQVTFDMYKSCTKIKNRNNTEIHHNILKKSIIVFHRFMKK